MQVAGGCAVLRPSGRHGREQRLRVGVQRIGIQPLLWRNLVIWPRYMTAIRSLMWRTTARSCDRKKICQPQANTEHIEQVQQPYVKLAAALAQPFRTSPSFVQMQAALRPDHTALIHGERRIAWREPQAVALDRALRFESPHNNRPSMLY